jgi:hypothetical protein
MAAGRAQGAGMDFQDRMGQLMQPARKRLITR